MIITLLCVLYNMCATMTGLQNHRGKIVFFNQCHSADLSLCLTAASESIASSVKKNGMPRCDLAVVWCHHCQVDRFRSCKLTNALVLVRCHHCQSHHL